MSTTGTDLTGIAGWAVSLMETLGPTGAGIAVAVENLFPPIPSEVILPLAGFSVAQGTMSMTEAILFTTAGSVIGATVLYYIGFFFGRDRMYAIVDWLPLVKTSELEKAEEWFAKHGQAAVFFGRMIPLIRSLISVPAGVERMPVGKFILLTAAGSAIWNSIFIVAGYMLGEQWDLVERYAGWFQMVVIAAVVAAVAYYLFRKLRPRQRPEATTAD